MAGHAHNVESCNVVVLAEGVHHHGVGLELRLSPLWRGFHDSGVEGVKVDERVDSSSIKRGHAAIVIRPGIDVIDLLDEPVRRVREAQIRSILL